MNSNNLSKNFDLALLLLRIGVAVVFLYHGWGKLTGIEGVQQFFGNIGIPLPGLMAWVVGIVEFIGGLLVLVGYKIRIPCILLAIVMVVAILTVKIGAGFEEARIDFVLLLVNISLALTGAGGYSVEAKMSSSGESMS